MASVAASPISRDPSSYSLLHSSTARSSGEVLGSGVEKGAATRAAPTTQAERRLTINAEYCFLFLGQGGVCFRKVHHNNPRRRRVG